MPSSVSLCVFAGAALALLLMPGPAVLYIVARSAAQGRRAGLASVAGIHVGTAVHVLAALLGLSAVIVASAAAFTVVKLAGAAYLVYLGVRSLLAARRLAAEAEVPTVPPRTIGRVFRDGIVLNVLNPKTAVFFLAFVPQFVDVDGGSPTTQLLAFGALFIAIGLVTDGGYALAGSWIGRRLRGPARAGRREVVSGLTFIGLGLVTASAGGSE